jgi:hypothetical protein
MMFDGNLTRANCSPRTGWGGRLVAATAVALLLIGSLASVASAAPRPIEINLFLGSDCVFGFAKPVSVIKVVIRDSDGVLRGKRAAVSDDGGFWAACGTNLVTPGDSIKVAVFETGQTKTVTVPLLTVHANRGTNVVSGRAPSTGSLTLNAFESRFGSSDDFDISQPLAVSAGSYSLDFDSLGINLRGGAFYELEWESVDGHVHAIRRGSVPFVELTLHESTFFGATTPNGFLKVTLTDPAQVAVGKGIGDMEEGFVDGRFTDANGSMYRLKGGEHLSAPALLAQSSYDIPAINGTVNLSSDVISGKCFPNGMFVVFAFSVTTFEAGVVFGVAAANGSVSEDFSPFFNVRSGDQVQIICYSAGGDEVVHEFSAGGGAASLSSRELQRLSGLGENSRRLNPRGVH